MRYGYDIDKQIIAILSKKSTFSFNELLKNVEEYLKRPVSRPVFTFHLNKLQNDNVIGKRDKGLRGIKVHYFLTGYGKQQLLLYPSKGQEDKERLENPYPFMQWILCFCFRRESRNSIMSLHDISLKGLFL
jgi:hypothetical protein